ncbi:MAG: hypothetical protein WD960_09250 [Gemmatimonadota bacterium]
MEGCAAKLIAAEHVGLGEPVHEASLRRRERSYVLIDDGSTGTSHGSSWRYDTHVPLLWLGHGILPGASHTPASVADIASTLSALLGVLPPAATSGRILGEILPTGLTARP